MALEENGCYGLDLNWDSALVSRYNKAAKEPEPVCSGRDEQELLMPLVVGKRSVDGTWLSGQEAVRAYSRGEAGMADGLLLKLLVKEEILLGEETYSAAFLMEEYLRRVIVLMRASGEDGIGKIAVTLPERACILAGVLTGIFQNLGIEKECLMFLSHTECFMRYIVSMKPELWANDAALFECDNEHFYYDRVFFSKRREPVVVMSERKDLSALYYEGGIDKETAERKAYWFYNMVREQLSSRLITSIFVTGTGFLDGWALEALQKLSVDFRVFYGQNLFARGACYAAYMEALPREYIFLNENMTREDIMIKAYRDASEQYFVLSDAGNDYRKVGAKLTFILDDTDEIEFLVNHVMRKEPVHEVMILEHLMQRENKTVRLELSLFYADRDTPVVQLRDIGFANEGSSCRIWEQIL